MARQEIDLTTPQPNGKMGEPTKTAWEKVNYMTAEIYDSPGMQGSVSGKNMLINCGVPINQRLFGGGALAGGVYGYDRWKGGTGGCNVSIDATTGVFTHTSGAIQQIVEAPQQAWGQELTFSVENPTGTLSVSIGGATGTITPGSGRRSVTVTPTGSGHMTVQITASGATYSRPQLERGSSATAFDARPWAVEFSMCQRYYEKSYRTDAGPGTADTQGYMSALISAGGYFLSSDPVFKVSKRVIPAVSIFRFDTGGPGEMTEYSTVGSLVAGRAVTLANISTNGFQVRGNGSATSGNNVRYQWTADAEI